MPKDLTKQDVVADVVERDTSNDPYFARFRAPFSGSAPHNGGYYKFNTGEVINSQHYAVDVLLNNGAQLDLVQKDDKGKWEVLDTLN